MENLLLKIFPHRDIYRDAGENVYLRRFYIIPRRERKRDKKASFSVRVHKIYLSDDAPDMHDHPWDFLSIVLKNGYLEETPGAQKRRRVGSIIRHKAEDLHRLHVSPGKPALTLVFFGKRRREWGFSTPNGWIPWYDYENPNN